jgi:hypothetical protein
MSELKACPFCGLIIHDPNGIEKTCECPNDMDHMSRALWNTRPIEDALRSTITAQEDVIRRLKEDAERLAKALQDYAIDDNTTSGYGFGCRGNPDESIQE